MKLIDEWKMAHKMISVQAMTAAVAIQGAWVNIPEDMKSSIPPQWVHYLTMGLLVLGVIGRCIKQGDTLSTEDKNEVHP